MFTNRNKLISVMDHSKGLGCLATDLVALVVLTTFKMGVGFFLDNSDKVIYMFFLLLVKLSNASGITTLSK